MIYLFDKLEVSDFFFRYSLSLGFPHDRNNPRSPDVPAGLCHKAFVCRKIAQKLDGFEGFHFHQLRHTYTSNLLANGAEPKDVQELLGHSDVSTTMNVYAHSTRKAKRESARLLDKVAGND